MAKKTTKEMPKVDPSDMMTSLRSVARKVLTDDAVYSGTDSDLGEPCGFIPCNVPELNDILDAGGRGFPMGRIIEVFGDSQTGKSGLAYDLIAKLQGQGGLGVLIVAEGEFSRPLAKSYGVDTDRILVVDTNVVEECFETIQQLIKANPSTPMLFVVDSVAGLSTRAEFESESFDYDRQAQIRAQLISKALRKIGAVIPRTPHTLFLINQVNEGETAPQGFKLKKKPVGGVRIAFYASVRIRLEPTGKFTRTSKGVKYTAGFKVLATIEKNRLHTPMQSVELLIDFEKGVRSLKTKNADEDFSDE